MNGQRNISRLKRDGDEFEFNQAIGNGSEQSAKKARFDVRNPSTLAREADDEDDAILELDEIGRKRSQTKRNAVEVDGYESDSSNDNFNARADEKARSTKRKERELAKSQDEEANDMFADLEEEVADGDEDEELTREGKKKQKSVKFMDQNEIVGQVSSSKSGGHVSADFSLSSSKGVRDDEVESSSEEGGDEERDRLEEGMDEELGAGSKKKHAPKLDAFNMKNEEEEGKFDQSGNFVRKATDPFALHDAWLVDSTSKSEMKKAKEAHDKREEDRRRRAMEDDAVPIGDILAALIARLEDSETVLEALARLAASKDKKKPKWQKNKRKTEAEMEIDSAPAEDDAEKRRRETVEAITAAADQLLTRGQMDIYEAERGLLMRQYRRETGEDWVRDSLDSTNPDQLKHWEYRWSDGRDGEDNHGPYDGTTMAAWNEAGYFGEGVEFREVGTEGWTASVDFV